MHNNVINNDTYINFIFNQLWLDFIKKEYKLYCISHIINFTTQAFLC